MGDVNALWYSTRGSAIILSQVLFTAVAVLGILTAVRWQSPRWPRFLSEGLHRSLALSSLVFLAIHIVTSTIDPFTALGWESVLLPFAVDYKPLFLGLGCGRDVPARGDHGDEPAARTHRASRLAARPLADLRVLADRDRPRDRHRHRYGRRLDAGHQRSVHRGRDRGSGLADRRRRDATSAAGPRARSGRRRTLGDVKSGRLSRRASGEAGTLVAPPMPSALPVAPPPVGDADTPRSVPGQPMASGLRRADGGRWARPCRARAGRWRSAAQRSDGGGRRREPCRPSGAAGAVADHGPALIPALEATGSAGRGGAGFPVGRKWRSVAERSGGGAVIVANGAEGKPTSRKDRVLMALRPHLVIDGALIAANAVGADEVVLFVGQEHRPAVEAMTRALGGTARGIPDAGPAPRRATGLCGR